MPNHRDGDDQRRPPGPIPRFAIEKIEKALRNHPEALAALLKALAEGEEIIQVNPNFAPGNDKDSGSRSTLQQPP